MNLRHIESLRLGCVYLRFAFRLESPRPFLSSFFPCFLCFQTPPPTWSCFLLDGTFSEQNFRAKRRRRRRGRRSVISLDVRWQHCRSRSDIFRIEERQNYIYLLYVIIQVWWMIRNVLNNFDSLKMRLYYIIIVIVCRDFCFVSCGNAWLLQNCFFERYSKLIFRFV